MKKILILIVCLLMVFAFPISAYAEELPAENEVVEEELTNEIDWVEVKGEVSAFILNWIKPHIEEISVIITLVFWVINSARDRKKTHKDMAVMNNNTITMANNSNEKMTEALVLMQASSDAVTQYDGRITELLDAFNTIMRENGALRSEFGELKKYLHSSAESNIEFANELAELLALANIPNYKKEELGKRHIASVDAIRMAEAQAEAAALPVVEEVKENVEKA